MSIDLKSLITSEINRLANNLSKMSKQDDSAPLILSERMDRDFRDISHRLKELESDIRGQLHSFKADSSKRIEDLKLSNSDSLLKHKSFIDDTIEQLNTSI